MLRLAERNGLFAFLVVERLDEGRLEQLASFRPFCLVGVKAILNELGHFLVLDHRQRHGRHTIRDFAVYLRRTSALFVGQSLRYHLKHAHAEGVDVHLAIVVLLVELWSHKFGCAQH